MLADSYWTTPKVNGVTGLICGPPTSTYPYGNCSLYPKDTWQGVARYAGARGRVSDTSRSLVLAPIWQDCASLFGGWSNGGGNKFEIVGFEEVFIDDVQSNGITPSASPS